MRVILMRHGNSLANQENRVVSTLEVGCARHGGPLGTGFGLSELGREEVAQSADSLAEYIVQQSGRHALPIRIVASPYARTQDTAQVLHDHLQKRLKVNELATNVDLKERFFGDFDMQIPSDELYKRVWKHDAKDMHHTEFNVESVHNVILRMVGVVHKEEMRAAQYLQQYPVTITDLNPATEASEVESPPEGGDLEQHYWVILVSHGDGLQMLQTTMQGWRGERHRELETIRTAGWREVSWDEGVQQYH